MEEELPREANIQTNRALEAVDVFIVDLEEVPRDKVIQPIRKALKLLLSLCYITHSAAACLSSSYSML